MVWDAAAHWIVERLVAEGALPSVRRLMDRGVRAAARPPAPNCQTPPSLATLFTGSGPERHGITGYRVPVPAGPIGESRSGFDRAALLAEPVWETAGRAGLRTAAVHVPWVLDGGAAPVWLDGAVEAYSRRTARHGVHELAGDRIEFEIGAARLQAVADGPLVRVSGDCGQVEVARDWVPLRLPGGSGVWLCQAEQAGRRTLMHTGAWVPRTAGRNRPLTKALDGAPVFAGEGLGSLYRRGALGPRLAEGGDGSSEDLFLSSVGCVHRSFAAATEVVLAGHEAELVVLYLPTTDDVGHELLGWCDPRSAAHRPDIAPAVWARLTDCYRWADALLGRVLDRAESGDTVLLSADHGMAGAAWTLHPNTVLASAGLAAVTEGRLDPHRSAVLYHPANNGSLWVNDDSRAAGRVPGGECAGLLRRAEAALRSAAGTLLAGLTTAEDGRSAQLLFAPDCLPSAELSPDGRAIRPAAKTGAHMTNQGDDRLHAVLVAAGPGLSAGDDLGVLDNTWPAQLVLHQLAGPNRL